MYTTITKAFLSLKQCHIESKKNITQRHTRWQVPYYFC